MSRMTRKFFLQWLLCLLVGSLGLFLLLLLLLLWLPVDDRDEPEGVFQVPQH